MNVVLCVDFYPSSQMFHQLYCIIKFRLYWLMNNLSCRTTLTLVQNSTIVSVRGYYSMIWFMSSTLTVSPHNGQGMGATPKLKRMQKAVRHILHTTAHKIIIKYTTANITLETYCIFSLSSSSISFLVFFSLSLSLISISSVI